MRPVGLTGMTRFPAAVGAILLLGGCASVAEGTVDQSRESLVTSSPSGAVLMQDGRTICRTPCTVRQQQLNLIKPLTFAFPDGRQLVTDPVLEWNGNALGNAVFGGGVGLFVDALSGRVVRSDRRIHAEAP